MENSRRPPGLSRSQKNPQEFYGRNHPKRRELAKIRKATLAQQRQTIKDVEARGVQISEDKQFEEKAEECVSEPKRQMTVVIPGSLILWVNEQASEYHATQAVIIERLIKCAMQKTQYHMEHHFNAIQRAFYKQELRRKKRLEKLAEAKAKLKEKTVHVSDAPDHSFHVKELETE